MGQYHYVFNLDDREYLYPHKLGNGLKLMEFGSSALGTVNALALLLADAAALGPLAGKSPFGNWAGKRLVIGGDYADPDFCGEILAAEGLVPEEGTNLYHLADHYFTEVSGLVRPAVLRYIDPQHPMSDERFGPEADASADRYVRDVILKRAHDSRAYVHNLDKNEVLLPAMFGDAPDLLSFAEDRDGMLTGLCVLLANSNGRGGGDLHSNSRIIGHWAGDRIVIAGGDPPADAKDVSDAVIDALIEGEREWSPLTKMDRTATPRVREHWYEFKPEQQS